MLGCARGQVNEGNPRESSRYPQRQSVLPCGLQALYCHGNLGADTFPETRFSADAEPWFALPNKALSGYQVFYTTGLDCLPGLASPV